MTWASCRKASGDMVPGFSVLIATRVVPFQVPAAEDTPLRTHLRGRGPCPSLLPHPTASSGDLQTAGEDAAGDTAGTVGWEWSLPIHTSPKQPCPSLTSSRSDSRGISQASLARPWVWGLDVGQTLVRRWHKPSACSSTRGGDTQVTLGHSGTRCLYPTSSPQNTSGTHTQTLTLFPITQAAFHQDPPQPVWGPPAPHLLPSSPRPAVSRAPRVTPGPHGDPRQLPTGVIGHELLQAVELGAGGDVEATTVQLADLVVLHVQPLGVVEVGDGEAVGTCGQDRGAGGRCAADRGSPWGPAGGWARGSRTGQPRARAASPLDRGCANKGHPPPSRPAPLGPSVQQPAACSTAAASPATNAALGWDAQGPPRLRGAGMPGMDCAPRLAPRDPAGLGGVSG